MFVIASLLGAALAGSALVLPSILASDDDEPDDEVSPTDVGHLLEDFVPVEDALVEDVLASLPPSNPEDLTLEVEDPEVLDDLGPVSDTLAEAANSLLPENLQTQFEDAGENAVPNADEETATGDEVPSDLILGSLGNDDIIKGTDTHTIGGGDGDDRILASGSEDRVFGGAGDDYLAARNGGTLVGGLGNDTMVAQGANPDVTTTMIGTVLEIEDGNLVDLDTGRDVMSSSEADTVMVAGSSDVANLGSGEDTVVLGDWVDDDAVLIRNFDASEDAIVLVYDDAGPAPEIAFARNDLSADQTTVLMDGAVVAHVTSGEALSLDDIRLVPLSQTDLVA